jgi:hypothetical protein
VDLLWHSAAEVRPLQRAMRFIIFAIPLFTALPLFYVS